MAQQRGRGRMLFREYCFCSRRTQASPAGSGTQLHQRRHVRHASQAMLLSAFTVLVDIFLQFVVRKRCAGAKVLAAVVKQLFPEKLIMPFIQGFQQFRSKAQSLGRRAVKLRSGITAIAAATAILSNIHINKLAIKKRLLLIGAIVQKNIQNIRFIPSQPGVFPGR